MRRLTHTLFSNIGTGFALLAILPFPDREGHEEPRRTRRSPSGGEDRPEVLVGWEGPQEVFLIRGHLYRALCADKRP